MSNNIYANQSDETTMRNQQIEDGDLVNEYDRAASRCADAAATIRRHATKATVLSDSKITRDRCADAKMLADRLEAIVKDFGLDS